MRPWQKYALSIIRNARAHATRTSNPDLHLACGRAIEAMIAEGGQVPSDLRLYAQQARELHQNHDFRRVRLHGIQLSNSLICPPEVPSP